MSAKSLNGTVIIIVLPIFTRVDCPKLFDRALLVVVFGLWHSRRLALGFALVLVFGLVLGPSMNMLNMIVITMVVIMLMVSAFIIMIMVILLSLRASYFQIEAPFVVESVQRGVGVQ